MNANDGSDADLAGTPIDEAVEAVVADDDDRDPDRVRAALERVTEDGVVSRDAVDDALAHTANVVATPETRVELADSALDDASETADGLTEYDVVTARLRTFEERLTALQERLDSLTETFQTVVDVAESTDSLYTVARGIQAVTAEANAVQRDADELTGDVEDFETWLTDPDARADELTGDADALDETLADLERAADGVADAVESDADAVELPGSGTAAPAVAWFDASVRYRMVGLLLADLQAETATLQTWAEDEGSETEGLRTTEERLADLEARHEALGERLADLAQEDWRTQYGEPLGDLESRFDEMEPPVDWNEVQATLEEHRSVLE